MSDPQTPLYTALCQYAAARPLRFHMPGHKGLPVFDGAVSAEHGIGRGKKRYLGEKVGDGCLALMRSIKRAFDPEQILNPGKIF